MSDNDIVKYRELIKELQARLEASREPKTLEERLAKSVACLVMGDGID